MTRIFILTALLLTLSLNSASAQEERRGLFSRGRRASSERVEHSPKESPIDSLEQAQAEEVVDPFANMTPVEADTTITLKYSATQIDSLISKWSAMTATENIDRYHSEYIGESSTLEGDLSQDSLFKLRLSYLASPIALPYNDIVKSYISRYSNPRYSTMSNVLGLSYYYFPTVEEELIKYDLPVELRAMAIIESALSADAVSRAGAAGLWQFMPATGKAYGLEVNSLVDERCNPFLATDAACRFLRDLYSMFGNWTLAIAAYNCGPGNVNKALTRAGLDKTSGSFWDIYEYLPRETRGYVPAFIGATYAYAYHREHGIKPAATPIPLATDTIHINKITHLEQVSEVLELPIETLRKLNPQYRKDIIPATKQSYSLRLPQSYIASFIENEELIHSRDSIYLKEFIDPEKVEKAMETPRGSVHVIKSGETLGAIARRYGITQRAIMNANNIKNAHRIYAGQRLVIPN